PELVGRELDVVQVRMDVADGRAQSPVERADGAVPLRRAEVALAVHPDLDRRLRLHPAVLALLGDDAPGLQSEKRLVAACLTADQEIERAVRGLELKAARLELLHPLDDPRGLAVLELHACLLGAGLDRALAGELG